MKNILRKKHIAQFPIFFDLCPQFCRGRSKLVYFTRRKQIFLLLRIRSGTPGKGILKKKPHVPQSPQFQFSARHRHICCKFLISQFLPTCAAFRFPKFPPLPLDKFLFPVCILNRKEFNRPIRSALFTPILSSDDPHSISISFFFLSSISIGFAEISQITAKNREFC